MPVWITSTVEQTPEIELCDWQIYEVCDNPEMNNLTRHFVGYNLTEGEGRASSAIQVFDPVRRVGITNSGRVYKLIGEPGRNSDADYVWARWMTINKVTGVNIVTEAALKNEATQQV